MVIPVSLSFVRAPALPSYAAPKGRKTVVHSLVTGRKKKKEATKSLPQLSLMELSTFLPFLSPALWPLSPYPVREGHGGVVLKRIEMFRSMPTGCLGLEQIEMVTQGITG